MSFGRGGTRGRLGSMGRTAGSRDITIVPPTRTAGLSREAKLALACNALRLGAPMKHAADAAGIDESTIYEWMKDPNLSQPLREARSEAFLSMLERGTGVSSGPGGAQFWLERQHRAEFGRDPAVVVDQRTQTLSLQLDSLGTEELETLTALLRKALPQAIPDSTR